MRYPIAIETGSDTTAYGVVVPDLPGCFSAGDTIDEPITADTFLLKSRNIRVYRIRQKGKATVLCLSRDDALAYLKDLQAKRLQAKQGR